jgi:hypothetical protein
MKTALKIGAAALALSLMTSAAAFAQANQTNATPGMGAPPATDAMPATGAPAGQGAMPGSSAMDSQSGGATPPSATDQSSATASAAETANTPAGSPPSTYPVCKHKGEDRCMQEASLSGSHHMRHRIMKPKTSMDAAPDASGAAAPATPPAPGQ